MQTCVALEDTEMSTNLPALHNTLPTMSTSAPFPFLYAYKLCYHVAKSTLWKTRWPGRVNKGYFVVG